MTKAEREARDRDRERRRIAFWQAVADAERRYGVELEGGWGLYSDGYGAVDTTTRGKPEMPRP